MRIERIEMKTKDRTTPDYQPGKNGNKVAIVLSAPGSTEEQAGHPLAGKSRLPVEKLIKKGHDTYPKRFPSANLNDLRIINVSKDVHYKKKTGDTEGLDRDNLSLNNLKRVSEKLLGMETIIPLGNKAQNVINKIECPNKVILPGRHPSNQSLNNTKTGGYKSDKETVVERVEDRIEQFSDAILEKLKK